MSDVKHTHAWLATTDASQTHRAALGAQIQDLNERIGEHRTVTKSLPHKVPVGETLDPDTVVRLEPERKIFTDLVRTLAYRAESALLGRVGPLLARDGEEGAAHRPRRHRGRDRFRAIDERLRRPPRRGRQPPFRPLFPSSSATARLRPMVSTSSSAGIET